MKETCRGFTLIELLVTISIIALLFGVGVARYTEFNRRQVFDQTVLEFKSSLRTVQQKALSGEKDDDACTEDLDGWVLHYIDADTYEIYGKCGTNDFGYKPIELPPGVTFGSFIPIMFRTLGYGPEWDTNLALVWSVELTGSGKTQTIQVTRSGEIK